MGAIYMYTYRSVGRERERKKQVEQARRGFGRNLGRVGRHLICDCAERVAHAHHAPMCRGKFEICMLRPRPGLIADMRSSETDADCASVRLACPVSADGARLRFTGCPHAPSVNLSLVRDLCCGCSDAVWTPRTAPKLRHHAATVGAVTLVTHPRQLDTLVRNSPTWALLHAHTDIVVAYEATRLGLANELRRRLKSFARVPCLWSEHMVGRGIKAPSEWTNCTCHGWHGNGNVYACPVLVTIPGGGPRARAENRTVPSSWCRSRATYEYSAGTRWFAVALKHVPLLSIYTYVAKVDGDVQVNTRPSWHLAGNLSAMPDVIHTGLTTDSECGYAKEVSDWFRKAAGRTTPSWRGGIGKYVLYSNVLFLRTQWLQKVLPLALKWYDDEATWLHRWGDQQFWTHALAFADRRSRVMDCTQLRSTASFIHSNQHPTIKMLHLTSTIPPSLPCTLAGAESDTRGRMVASLTQYAVRNGFCAPPRSHASQSASGPPLSAVSTSPACGGSDFTAWLRRMWIALLDFEVSDRNRNRPKQNWRHWGKSGAAVMPWT